MRGALHGAVQTLASADVAGFLRDQLAILAERPPTTVLLHSDLGTWNLFVDRDRAIGRREGIGVHPPAQPRREVDRGLLADLWHPEAVEHPCERPSHARGKSRRQPVEEHECRHTCQRRSPRFR